MLFKIEVELENRDFRKSLYFYKVDAEKKKNGLPQAEAAIEGVQASVDALKLLSASWILKIEIVIVFGNI